MTVLGVPGHPLTVMAALVPKSEIETEIDGKSERERGRAFVSPAALRQVEFPMLLDPVPGKANTPPPLMKVASATLETTQQELAEGKVGRFPEAPCSQQDPLAAVSCARAFALRLSSTMSLADPSCVPMSDLAVHGTSHELTTLHQQPQKAPSHRPIVGDSHHLVYCRIVQLVLLSSFLVLLVA